MKKLLRLLLILSVFISSSIIFTGCDDDIILVTGVDLYTNEMYVDVNQTVDLSYKVYPNNASNKKVTFWSTDENIASVDDAGKVTVKAAGEASIVVRSVDGGFEDYCKIKTNIDPDAISWDTTDKLTELSGEGYSAAGSMALNQVMKLKVNYLIDEKISDLVTNKNVVFTSSNPSNIEIINDKEGIIKAINNEIWSGERAYSDITATLRTKNGTLSITCRIFINEYSSLDNLHVKYKNGDMKVLNQRNGTETIYLTSGGNSVEFYAYLTNFSGVVKTDYDMSIVSSSEEDFSVEILSTEKGIYRFKLTPSDNERPATLYIRTTCSDENGKAIRCNINVSVQAEIASATASATTRSYNGTEVLVNGEIFSVGLTYYDTNGYVIDGAKRNIYFDPFEDNVANFISNYGDNQFKVKAVPQTNQMLTITGYFYVENVESSEKITFEYVFYVKNSLESLIVSKTPKEHGVIPSQGVSTVTIPAGGEVSLYAYATTFNFALSEPANVDFAVVDNASIVSIGKGSNNLYTIRSTGDQGIATVLFMATDGIITINYEVTVYVVARVANVVFYTNCDSNGNLSNKIDSTYIVDSGTDVLRLYLQVESTSPDYIIECESAIKLSSSTQTVQELVCDSGEKVVRYIDLDLTGIVGSSLSVNVYADRLLIGNTITIQK